MKIIISGFWIIINQILKKNPFFYFEIFLRREKMIKTFELTQQIFEMSGITRHQSTKKYPFNVRILTYLPFFSLSDISCAYYLGNKSNTFIEYIACFYLLTSMSICFMCYVHIVSHMSDVFAFIMTIDNFLEGSK